MRIETKIQENFCRHDPFGLDTAELYHLLAQRFAFEINCQVARFLSLYVIPFTAQARATSGMEPSNAIGKLL